MPIYYAALTIAAKEAARARTTADLSSPEGWAIYREEMNRLVAEHKARKRGVEDALTLDDFSYGTSEAAQFAR